MQEISQDIGLSAVGGAFVAGSVPTRAAARRAAVWRRQAGQVRLTCETVARVYNVPMTALCAQTRGEAPVARARQVAMYLAHVTFGMSLGAVGRHFGRDRTTASYACHRIEDRRDEAGFDLMLDRLETALAALADVRFGAPEKTH